LRIDQP